MAKVTDSAGPDFKNADDNIVPPTVDLVENNDPDAEFGGSEERRKMEKRLVRKLDARMTILIVIYILNYVRRYRLALRAPIYAPFQRSTEIMQREPILQAVGDDG